MPYHTHGVVVVVEFENEIKNEQVKVSISHGRGGLGGLLSGGTSTNHDKYPSRPAWESSQHRSTILDAPIEYERIQWS